MSLASSTRMRPPQSGFVQTGLWEAPNGVSESGQKSRPFARAVAPDSSAHSLRTSYTPFAMIARTNLGSRCSVLCCAVVSVLICASLFAQDRTAEPSRAAAVLDSMPHAKKIGQVALSPDGTQVAYIVNGELAVTPASGGSGHAISVEGNLPLRDVAWSWDGK